jgi:hypothetical protein
LPAPPTRFVNILEVRRRLKGKRVAIVGSGPGVLDNEPGFIDGHDETVRVNNYKLSDQAGSRTTIFYSFFGHSIRKSVADLKRDGVTLLMCKCPNERALDSDWHRRHRMEHGVDFRWIYKERAKFWFCDVYVPTLEAFLAKFKLLGNHIPTTGFSAILDILACHPAHVTLTGFDFFRSGLHNVDERWREKNLRGDPDPVAHIPEVELKWLADNLPHLPVSCDRRLTQAIESVRRAA